MNQNRGSRGLRDAQNWCRAIVDSAEYRDKFRIRAIAGDLPPAVEVRMLDYAYGRPIEQHELLNPEVDLSELSNEELRVMLRELEDCLDSKPADDVDEVDDGTLPGIH